MFTAPVKVAAPEMVLVLETVNAPVDTVSPPVSEVAPETVNAVNVPTDVI